MKTLNQFTIEAAKSYLDVRSPDEEGFIKKHVVAKHQDNNGNGDDVFNASKVKTIKRKGERHGYDSGDDEKVYEQKMDKPDIKDGDLVKGNKLSGDRYKIDANKNGEIDAEDLKLLRLRKKKMKEEAGQIDELSSELLSRAAAAAKGKANWAHGVSTRVSGVEKERHSNYTDTKVNQAKKFDAASKSKNPNISPKPPTYYSGSSDEQPGYGHKNNPANKPKYDPFRYKKEEVEDLDEGNPTLTAAVKRAENSREIAIKRAARDVNRGSSIESAIRNHDLFAKDADKIRSHLTKEEVEDLDEVLKPSMGVKSYIDDFIKSKNSKFEGDTKKQRIKRAVAAYYSDLRGEGLELPDNVIESLVDTFDQLSEGNQEVFIEMSESEDGINQLIDFIIANRGN
jgi:hypothetical protein